MEAREFATELLTLLDEAGLSINDDIDRTRECLDQAQRLLSSHKQGATEDRAPQGQGGQGLAPWQVRRIARFVEENLHQMIRTEELAGIARLSVSHFSRAFRDSFGQAPYAYVLYRRIARAKQMMRESDEPLAQIALCCGMADQAHFSRLFRRLTGETPSHWRRRHARTGAL
nr:AraC family transcriptional regulator [Rhizobium sp. CSW-27]